MQSTGVLPVVFNVSDETWDAVATPTLPGHVSGMMYFAALRTSR